jgi:DNA invertase Pin-like site-specific DNA recombinase
MGAIVTSTSAGATTRPAPSFPPRSSDRRLRRTAVLGYTSDPRDANAARCELERQAEVITRACARRELRLIEVVHEREPRNGKARNRPGLASALNRIASGEASGLVVSELGRLTHSAAELGGLIDWLRRSNARFVAAADGLDTGRTDGRLAAKLLVEVSRWESARLSERTRDGLRAARRGRRASNRPAVADDPQLRERIAQMRADGMTLQAIADRLNDERVPTVRGGAKWRHSSIQAAAGYRRPPRAIAHASRRG